ncbi:antibiotic biosynthesis monooxygenase [Variovorax ureilyticus]|uniref:Antibiotic biosynthesis monooxygenase n=1 Tax=Variovorax ureilyticus TaxID=1836198 RepID=A0ABU8VKV6_9BURK
MKHWLLVLAAPLAVALSILPADATAADSASVVEVVTFRLKPGVSAAEFARVDEQVELQHVSQQPGFISRESAVGTNNDWLVIVHWRSVPDAEASMGSFEKAPAAASFMSKIEGPTMSMKRYQAPPK